MALRHSSRIKQSCSSGTKQQEQKKLRSSSKAGKNTVPTKDEELTEQDAKQAKAFEPPAATTKRKSNERMQIVTRVSGFWR